MTKISDILITYQLFFQALANYSRLAILSLLEKGPKTVTEISKELGFEQSRVSHNLTCLAFCGFITSERNGKNKVYSLNTATIQPLLGLVDQHIEKYASNLRECKVLKR
ncbi:MAG: ArsR/SmtB family transcription factor [Candidatus Heimdallarchaeota archaeon]